jgi:hypothetical protein
MLLSNGVELVGQALLLDEGERLVCDAEVVRDVTAGKHTSDKRVTASVAVDVSDDLLRDRNDRHDRVHYGS